MKKVGIIAIGTIIVAVVIITVAKVIDSFKEVSKNIDTMDGI